MEVSQEKKMKGQMEYLLDKYNGSNNTTPL